MRRRISLYIGGILADLDDESLVIMNYTAEDVENPTVIRNSFSRQVTLPGTARNASIFGSVARLDRRIDRQTLSPVGAGFTPTQRTPFTIYDELGEILESGYIRLDKVSRHGSVVEGYTVTLFGGLGSFFYALSYSEGGAKLSLADLPYMTDDDTDLTFTINASAVTSAWASLADTGLDDIWDFINFAPCYNGIPANFDADHALVKPAEVGLPSSQVSGGETYTTAAGSSYALVNLPQDIDEWAAKDLRSYLQRPVLSIRGLLAGLANYAAKRGWTLDYSGVPFQDAWLTLPMLNTISTMKPAAVTLANASPGTSAPTIATLTPSPSLAGDTFSLYISEWLTFDAAINAPRLTGQRDPVTGIRPFTVIFAQTVSVSPGLSIVNGGSKVHVFAPSLLRTWTPQQIAQACAFHPDWELAGGDSYEDATAIPSFSGGGGTFDTDTFTAPVDAANADHFFVKVYAYEMLEDADGAIAKVDRADNGDYSTPVLYDSAGNAVTATDTYLSLDDYDVTIREGWLRSGATVKKRDILAGSNTPADYLIALAKIYGLSFQVDAVEKKVTVLQRGDFFQDETIDLTDRVDTSRTMDIYPLVVSSKWYDFVFQGDASAFWQKYIADYGRIYGLQRVNSGYDFDAGINDLLDGIALKGAATILDSSPLWNMITEGGTFRPSPFLLSGTTYTLYTSAGKSAEFQVPSPTSAATVTYYNTHIGYDGSPSGRLEFRDTDGKPQDGRDVLVFYNGKTTLSRFHVSDDLADMNRLNNQMPCWLFDASAGSVDVPDFGRYKFSLGRVTRSLDFGVPFELAIPGVTYPESASLYSWAWKAYIADRFDADTKIMHCWVDFGGIQVGPELLRKFYFYDGSIWALNKIVNYSLTTWDAVECELIQVQDTDAYTDGQNF